MHFLCHVSCVLSAINRITSSSCQLPDIPDTGPKAAASRAEVAKVRQEKTVEVEALREEVRRRGTGVACHYEGRQG